MPLNRQLICTWQDARRFTLSGEWALLLTTEVSVDLQAHRKLRRSLCVVRDDQIHLAFYILQVQLTVFLLKNYLVYIFHHKSKLKYIIVLIAVVYFKNSFWTTTKNCNSSSFYWKFMFSVLTDLEKSDLIKPPDLIKPLGFVLTVETWRISVIHQGWLLYHVYLAFSWTFTKVDNHIFLQHISTI